MVGPFTRQSEFVSDGLDARRWDLLEPLYGELAGRRPASVAELERLILDRSELEAAAAEAEADLYIAMTRDTDDPAVGAAYSRYVNDVRPRRHVARQSVDRVIVDSRFSGQLDAARYGVYLRNVRNSVALFRPENVAIDSRLAGLVQAYARTCGEMEIEYGAERQTIPQMMMVLEQPNREMREEAWRLVAGRRGQDRDTLDGVFDEMIALRHRQARGAGFSSYRDYMFRALRRFDYTPADCDAYAAGVERIAVPALASLRRSAARRLGVQALRPWDIFCDDAELPPLRPFETVDELVDGSRRMFDRLDGELGEMFRWLGDPAAGRLDLDTRPGKAPGMYQMTRDRAREPFIFMNASGRQFDVEIMAHEAGHAFQSVLTRGEPLHMYRTGGPMEFWEVASTCMEVATLPLLDEFYGRADAERARRVYFEQAVETICLVAAVDQFQHWMYLNPDVGRESRRAKWVELDERFLPAVDWSGLEDLRGIQWHRILHIFEVPFYYIEYGIAQLAAFGFWRRFVDGPGSALAAYKRGIALGGSRPLRELFEAVGAEFAFDEAAMRRVWPVVERETRR